MTTRYLKNKRALLVGVLLIVAPVFSGVATAGIAYTYVSFDLPDQSYNFMGINDSGQVVGNYTDAGLGRSFIMSGGNYTTFSGPPPGAGDTWGMSAQGINNNGEVVGNYFSAETGNQGFRYGNDSYQAITVPGSSWTYAFGINNNGQVVGWSGGFGLHQMGFVESGGVYTTIADPSPTTDSNFAMDINNSGQVAGVFQDEDYPGGVGYVRSSNGVYTILPNGIYNIGPWPIGINDSGLVLAWFQDGGRTAVFDGSEWSNLVNPDAPTDGNGYSYLTFSHGINDLGQLVGNYYDGTIYHGFIATPVVVPIPAAIWLFGSALAGLGLIGKPRSPRVKA